MSKKEETSCEICDSTFEYYPSSKEGKFCSSCVEDNKYQEVIALEAKKYFGKNHHEWKDPYQKECEECGEDFKINRPSKEKKFCSKECRRESYKGKGNPNWKGGPIGPYDGDWWSIRRKIRERDNFECQSCGIKQEELEYKLDVHHIIPVRNFEGNNPHKEDNLIALCRSCHRKIEDGAKEL